MADKKILDVTCGMRGIWFNKNHPSAVYCDKRTEHYESDYGVVKAHRTIDVKPDVECDFTNLPFEDESFSLVVFDPPHVEGLKDSAWITKMYGTLSDDWQQILKAGFDECMRVLKPDGVLVFKCSEVQVSTNEVWDAIGRKPLFGHHSGKKMNTYWGCFMKGIV